MTSFRVIGQAAVVALMAVITLTACSTSDDESGGATSTPSAAGTQPASAGTREPSLSSSVSGQTISDGLCQVTIPDGWVDDGTGRGTTTGGDRFELFGGPVANDAAWQLAAQVVATPRSARTIESFEQDADSVHAIFAAGEGFAYRVRFDVRYCDFSVTSSGGPISEGDRATWPAIIDSVAPAP